MSERSKNIIAQCGVACEACLRIAARCAALGDYAGAAQFGVYAAEWSVRAFEEAQP